jgi:pimeloyl-ACP methyl ester carboxylesterase
MQDNMPGPASHSFFSHRLRLHYVDWGNEGAPPLVLVHGGRDHCRNWDWVAARLRERYHVIAPDLRGHGDSEWAVGSSYALSEYVYDLAQLIHQTGVAPVPLIGHSLGGMIALRYAGVYPDNVSRLVAIEGLGGTREMHAKAAAKPPEERLGKWIDLTRGLSGRLPRRYDSLEDAYRRMENENPHLTAEQARHLTVHGANQNEDGTFSWKFDNYVRIFPAYDLPEDQVHALWARIACPTLLVRGTESWAEDPRDDGRADHFQNAQVLNIDGAGHWSHHDQTDVFMAALDEFLGQP